MPRGQPDYGITTQTPVASGISDPGEAAARLGSINVYDRRGWTVWMDDFEAPRLRWTPGCSLGGTLPVLSTAQAWMGAQSVYFVTAAVANANASLTRYFPLARLGRVGIEFFICAHIKTPGYFMLRLGILDGVNHSRAELHLDSEANTATIVTPLGNIIVATNCTLEDLYPIFFPIKLVVDMDTDLYTRLLVGPDEVDISGHRLNLVGAATDKLLAIQMYLMGGVAGAEYAFVDNFILTQNEP